MSYWKFDARARMYEELIATDADDAVCVVEDDSAGEIADVRQSSSLVISPFEETSDGGNTGSSCAPRGNTRELAELAMAEQDLARATDLWESLRSLEPDDEAGYELGAVALRNGARYVDSDEVAEMGYLRFRSAQYLVIRADTSMDQQHWFIAAARWARLRETFPDHPEGYARGTVALRNAGQFDDADAVTDEAIRRFGASQAWLEMRAHTAVDKGDWLSAARRYREAHLAFPGDLRLQINEAEALYFASRLDDAATVVETAIGTHGRVAELIHLLAVIAAQHPSEATRADELYAELFEHLKTNRYLNTEEAGFLGGNLRCLSDMVAHMAQAGLGSADCAPSIPASGTRRRVHGVEHVDRRSKVFISSVPKSGTHLLSRLLAEAGCRFNGLFVDVNESVLEIDAGFGGNRVYQHENIPGFPEGFVNSLDLSLKTALSLLRPSEHCLSHLPEKLLPKEWLPHLKVLALFRDPKSALRSEFLTETLLFSKDRPSRYQHEFAYIHGSGLPVQTRFEAWLMGCAKERAGLYQDLLAWAQCEHAMCLRYENLIGPLAHEEANRVLRFVGHGERPYDQAFVSHVLNQRNPTRRDGAGDVEDLWTDTALDVYQRVGFPEIERELNRLVPVRRVPADVCEDEQCA